MSKLKIISINIATFLYLLLFSTYSSAKIITLNFDSFIKSEIVTTPYKDSGFILTPNCHYDAGMPGYADYNSNWIGFDLSGCLDQGINAATLRLSKISGEEFDILSFFAVTNMFDVRSSKGGFVNVSDEIIGSFNGQQITERNIYFNSELWNKIEWIEFSTNAGEPEGIDNIVLRTYHVSQPSTVSMLFITFIFLILLKEKHKEPTI